MPIEPRVAVVIPARYASTRLPGKPLADIHGRPMIEWVVRRAKEAAVGEVLVATDDERVARAVEGFGGRAMMTSPSHASGTDRVAEVAAELDCDVVINVQGDEPLLASTDIRRLVEPFRGEGAPAVVTLMTPIRDLEQMFDTNVTKVVTDREGRALYFSKAPIPYDRAAWPRGVGGGKASGGDISGARKHLGIYAYSREFLMQVPALPVTRLEAVEKLEQLRFLEYGYTVRVLETETDSPGVDSAEDLERVRRLIGESGGKHVQP